MQFFLQAFAHYSAAATGFMGVVVATAWMAGKVRNATSAILNASLLIALSMAGVARGSASVILDGPENIAKHVSSPPKSALFKCLVCIDAFADEALVTEK